MNQISAYLSEDERPFWIFPRGQIVAGSGVTLDLDASEDAPVEGRLTWATAVQSVQDWIAHYRPPVLREHERNGESYGEIVRVVEVTQAQAAEWGVAQRGDALWGVARLHAQMRDAYDDGRVRTTSPHLAMPYTDDEGTAWPLAMLELSAVSDPRQKGRQVTTDNLSGVRLSESSPRITITRTHEAKMGEEYEARLASCEVALAEIREQLAAFADQMGQLMDAGAAQVGDSEAEEMTDPRDATVAKLASELDAVRAAHAELLEERATERAALAVDAALSERRLDENKRDHYIQIAKTNQALFAEIVAVAPERPKRKIGSRVGTALSEGGSMEDRLEALASEHGSYSAAYDIMARAQANG